VSLIARAYVDALGNERTVAPETVARFEALLWNDDRDFVAPRQVVREGEPIVLEVTLRR